MTERQLSGSTGGTKLKEHPRRAWLFVGGEKPAPLNEKAKKRTGACGCRLGGLLVGKEKLDLMSCIIVNDNMK